MNRTQVDSPGSQVGDQEADLVTIIDFSEEGRGVAKAIDRDGNPGKIDKPYKDLSEDQKANAQVALAEKLLETKKVKNITDAQKLAKKQLESA